MGADKLERELSGQRVLGPLPGGDVLGDGVNVASRLQESAEEGCISISGAVYRDVKNKAGITTEFIGEKTFKNVDEPVRLWTSMLTTDYRLAGVEVGRMGGGAERGGGPKRQVRGSSRISPDAGGRGAHGGS